MILASVKWGIDPLAWDILPRIDVGPLEISPHGLGIAIGYLAGARVMVKRAERRGGPDEGDIWNALFYALLGAIVGARVGYVLGHFSEVTDGGSDLLGVFKIWEGGISLLGGITGAILAALPYIVRRRMGFWRTMDVAAPGLALGIVIGRIGDLVIGDHLGKPTSSPLGWLCTGVNGEPALPASTYRAALEQGNPPSLGCFDLVVHQTAIYDLVSTALLLGVLVWLGRRARNEGFLILVFTVWYAAVRVGTDFLRVDKRYLGLTGSQITSILAGVAAVYLLARWRGVPERWRWRPAPVGDPEAEAQAALDTATEPHAAVRPEAAAAPDDGQTQAASTTERDRTAPADDESPPSGHPT